MFALQALTIIIVGFILLRIAGKKVISEMTPLEMVTTLAIGTSIGHAVSENTLWQTIVTIAIFVGVLITFQYIAFFWGFFQKLTIGKPTLVVLDGVILHHNLRKLRMTVEQLEVRIRQQGISNVSDIRTATVEVNGQLGYELIESSRPVTRGELEEALRLLQVAPEIGNREAKLHDVFQQVRKEFG